MLIYPNAEDIKALHDFLIEIYREEEFPEKIEVGYNYESAIDSIVDLALRDSLLGKPLFPHILQKAAVFLYYLNILHPFTDGNKRTSLLTAHYFLRWNGYRLNIPSDAAEFLIKIATPTFKLKYIDAYRWILQNSNRTIFDVLRSILLSLMVSPIDLGEYPFFRLLLDIYTYEPLPRFVTEKILSQRKRAR